MFFFAHLMVVVLWLVGKGSAFVTSDTVYVLHSGDASCASILCNQVLRIAVGKPLDISGNFSQAGRVKVVRRAHLFVLNFVQLLIDRPRA